MCIIQTYNIIDLYDKNSTIAIKTNLLECIKYTTYNYYNMATTAFSIRMDENLKNNFERMCESFGISMTAAFNLFATAVVNERRIPFEIKAKTVTKEEALFNIETMRTQALSKNPNGLTLDEINEEINKTRNQSGQ